MIEVSRDYIRSKELAVLVTPVPCTSFNVAIGRSYEPMKVALQRAGR